MNKNPLTKKRNRLLSILEEYGALVVAYSGGVDSSFLLAVAHEALKKNLVAVTASSPVHPKWEKQSATALARQLDVEHIIIPSREMSRPEFRSNTKDRCYFCKKYLCEDLLKIAGDRGIEHVAHGANLDDFDDFRPGFIAAREMGITAPLVDAKLTKNDIRMLSKQMNLNTWNTPSMACLATRIPYGTPITPKDLKMVEQAEQVLWGYGFTGCRVRKHGNVARIEVDTGDVQKFLDPEMRSVIVEKLLKINFFHVALDLEGYRQGSMNRDLTI
jgi:uncharacterized protein